MPHASHLPPPSGFAFRPFLPVIPRATMPMKISPLRSFFDLALLGTIAIVVRSGIFARSNPVAPSTAARAALLAQSGA